MMTLRGGLKTIVDDEDYETFGKMSGWYINHGGYVRRNGHHETTPFLHKMILPPPPGYYVDHINRNKLDNRKCNLRIVTPQQSAWNRGPNTTGSRLKRSCGYKGITWDRRRRRWEAYIQERRLGRFRTAGEAAVAYDIEARKRFGEYAYLNIIDSDSPVQLLLL